MKNMIEWEEDARAFCAEFLNDSTRPRLVLGINHLADSIAKAVNIDGYIDDFTDKSMHSGKPVFKMETAPKDALVVSAVTSQVPLTVSQKLRAFNFQSIDYFAFQKFTPQLDLPILYLNEFAADYTVNRVSYDSVRARLADVESVEVYDKIINFRLSRFLGYLEGFTNRQNQQYFEEFLPAPVGGEVFVDAGGFDGCTSEQFIKHYPNYKAVHIFEPEAQNYQKAERRLNGHHGVNFHRLGLSDRSGTVRFSARNFASAICDDGESEIQIGRLDDIVEGPVSFIKMDIEGAEGAALSGAEQTIRKNHPMLAIAAYHKYDDFRSIPEQILGYRDDYELYLRHYTEGVAETVMSFKPCD